jgi:hypothetical protein
MNKGHFGKRRRRATRATAGLAGTGRRPASSSRDRDQPNSIVPARPRIHDAGHADRTPPTRLFVDRTSAMATAVVTRAGPTRSSPKREQGRSHRVPSTPRR